MNRVPRFAFVSVLVLVVAVAGAVVQAAAAAQEPQEKAKPAAESKPQVAEKVTVVFLGNATCPGDGKAVDREKYVEVEGQRIYVCCEACVTALKDDAEKAKAALAKAYPTAKPVTAKACSCGEKVEAGKGTVVSFQGNQVTLCSADCVTEFRKSPVTTIVLMQHPELKDAKNASDPYDGKPVDPTIVAIYKTHLVHFSSWKNASTFEKDPSTAMTKLKLSS